MLMQRRRDVVFLFLLTLTCFPTTFGSGATLPPEEIDALKQIGQTLGKDDWNFSADPCSEERSWLDPSTTIVYENNVTCNCTYQDNTVCHVVSIVLRGQDLQGVLPPELAKLPYLQQIDLNRNYLNGTIPLEWGSIPLKKMSLEDNKFSGEFAVLLQGIEKLVSIKRIVISSNGFSGQLPTKLANLTSLKDFRITDNNFTGRIPGFIKNWTELARLEIQGTGLQGPIPSEISSLVNLTNLRISDINGIATPFPKLDNMKSIRTLILRNCKLTGSIPDYIWTMENLKTLDLSFNKLEGYLPPTLSKPKEAVFIDLSYNDFTPAILSKFYINCGGEEVTVHVNGTHRATTFTEDKDPGGASRYIPSRDRWAFSSTGNFLDNDQDQDLYIGKNISRLTMPDSQLYTTARLSPLSLTYYGLCLWNGNYTVKLHFADIMFSNNNSYRSLGKRIFDIYIQGKLVWKDFNIVAEAGGTHKAVVRNFTANVTTNTLEICFYWAGKGTQSLPKRGTYGPLISAISVESDFTPPGDKKIYAGAVIGIVASVFCVIFLIIGILWWKGCFRKKSSLYCNSNNLTEKSDVYSFGVVLLQLITGKKAIVRISGSAPRSLIDWAIPMVVGGDIMDVIDPKLEGNYDIKSIQKVAEIARACTSPKSIDRPHMRDVVVELKEYIGNEKAFESESAPENGGCVDSGPVLTTSEILSCLSARPALHKIFHLYLMCLETESSSQRHLREVLNEKHSQKF
ncbi:Protein kinase domain-containing protein [Cinnamomum micranthum f. kanehirae]|uniref:non-specific serine/threonine protein kinase n=1 Tax=Cinnamomum micranthum f. kanehirae TaxID=337451 RepID=A0A3S3PRI0_9MAGN|nr:Protein kinase domain-containing protein [Cinnamomum micranthum f. kanehirae]